MMSEEKKMCCINRSPRPPPPSPLLSFTHNSGLAFLRVYEINYSLITSRIDKITDINSSVYNLVEDVTVRPRSTSGRRVHPSPIQLYSRLRRQRNGPAQWVGFKTLTRSAFVKPLMRNHLTLPSSANLLQWARTYGFVCANWKAIGRYLGGFLKVKSSFIMHTL